MFFMQNHGRLFLKNSSWHRMIAKGGLTLRNIMLLNINVTENIEWVRFA